MCLDKGFKVPKRKSGTGYKVFASPKPNGNLRPISRYGKVTSYARGTWLNEKEFRPTKRELEMS